MALAILGLILILAWALRRHLYLSKWNHFPGYSSWTSFPFIGHLYKFGNKPIECLDKCQKNFGDIFRLDTATGPTVWLCNYKQITEAMKSDTFAGRPYHKLPGLPSCRDEKCQLFNYDKFGEFYSLVFANGQRCYEQRSFLMKYLASSKNSLDAIITHEVYQLRDEISKSIGLKGADVDIHKLFMKPINRVLWQVLTGRPISKEESEHLNNIIRYAFQTFERPENIMSFIQVLTPFGPPLVHKLGIEGNAIDRMKVMEAFIIKEIGISSSMSGLSYIELHKEKTKNAQPGSSFYGVDGWENLKGAIAALLLAGTDTSASALEWFLLYMTMFPEVQEKCFQEIHEAIGQNQPCLDDGKDTPYLKATLQEISRHCPHLALTVQHNTTKDTYIGGYFIPKQTSVQYYSGAVMHDAEYFTEPEKFNPERFIKPEDGSFVLDERVIYFGTGKRRCAGEVLGRAELYLFAVVLLQEFKFLPPRFGPKPELSYTMGLNMHAKRFSANVLPRVMNDDFQD